MLATMLPKPGVRIEIIETQLGDLLRGEGNLRNDHLESFLSWLHGVERVLCDLFSDVPLERLYADRFFHISKEPAPLHWKEMVGLERQRQREWLIELRDRIAERKSHFGDATPSGVLDSNSFLHYKPPDEIEWADMLGSPARLIVPLRVVQELDDKKASNSKPLRQRAAKRLAWIAGQTLGDGPHEVRPGVAIEVVESLDLDRAAERRPRIPADVEILDTCAALQTYNGGGSVYLVSGDLAMQVQAKARGIDAKLMPETAALPLDADPAAEA